MASDTHKDAEPATAARVDANAVRKIREFTGNNISHEEAKRLLLECDGDLQVALNRIADGLGSWSEVKEKPKKEKAPKKKREDGSPAGRGRGRGGARGGRGGRPEGGAPAPAANGSPQPERSARGGRGRGSERGGATQRPASASAPAPGTAAPAQAPKQPAAPQAAPAQPAAPQVARVPIPPPNRHPGLTAAQIVAGAHLQQQQAAQAQAHAHGHGHGHAHAHPQPAQAAAQPQAQPAAHSPAATAAHAHEAAHPGHSAPAQVAPAHAPAPAAQTHAAPVSQAPAAAPTTQQTAAAAAAPAPAAKTEAAPAATTAAAVPAATTAPASTGTAAPANGRQRQQNGKAKEGGRAPRNESQGSSPSVAKNPVVVLPSSVAHNVGDFQFGSFSMTPLSDNLPAVQPAAKPAQARAQQAAVQAPAPAHQPQQHAQQHQHQHHHAAHVTETSAQSVRPEAHYHGHDAHAAEQPVEEAGMHQIPPGYMYPPFVPVPFAYDGDAARMHPAYYEHPAAFAAAPYRGTSGSPVGDSTLGKLGSPQHGLDSAQQSGAAAGSSTAQPTPQHAAYNSQFLAAGFHPYYPSPYGGQFYPPAGYTNPRAYKPPAYMGYGAPEPEEAYGGGAKYAPHGAYTPGAAQTSGKPNQSQFSSPPAAPLDPYKQDFASKSYNSRETSAQAYPYQAYHQYYPAMHMPPYGGQPQGQASQPSGRGGNQ